MHVSHQNIFDRLDETKSDPAAMLDCVVSHLRQTKQPLELFEALKMQTRHALGLNVLPHANESALREDLERQLEAGLLAACREVGSLLMGDGRVGEGWMYLRPTGNTELARQLTAQIPIDDDNYDQMIQVLLHEGVDVARGFAAVLERQGTCNSITLFEQSLAGRSKVDRQAAAAKLLAHVHHELTTSVRRDILRREPPAPESESLLQLIDSRPWLLNEGGYHIDTTHLQSTVRIASVLDQPQQWQAAWELTQYGRRLHHQLQYPGDEPFVDFYPAYATYYAILLGRDVAAGLKHFERKARTVDPLQHGTAAIETYVDLLDRVGQQREAIAVALDLLPAEVPPQRIVPMLIEIALRAPTEPDSKSQPLGARQEALQSIADYCRRRGDVLGAVAAFQATANHK
jgi:hypothetical protein